MNITNDIDTASTIATNAGRVTITAAASATWWSFFTTNEFLVICSVICALVGVVINAIYRHREYQLKLAEDARHQREHEKRMSIMGGCDNGIE